MDDRRFLLRRRTFVVDVKGTTVAFYVHVRVFFRHEESEDRSHDDGFLNRNVGEAPLFRWTSFLGLPVIDGEHKGDFSPETHVDVVS